MTRFTLPQSSWAIPSLKVHEANEALINYSLINYLASEKNEIKGKIPQWDFYKIFTNPYEFLYTPLPNTDTAVSSLRPQSRSFYKFIEIYNASSLATYFASKDTVKAFFFAEAEGGFIEAFRYIRQNKSDSRFAMNLIPRHLTKGKPMWLNDSDVKFVSGSTDTGDLLEAENLLYCYRHHKNSCDLVTGDSYYKTANDLAGAEGNELSSFPLIVAQIAAAVCCQKKGGCFILRVYDTLSLGCMDVLQLLSTMYESLEVIKPQCSRIGNSEKYIVCKKYRVTDPQSLLLQLLCVIKQLKHCTYSTRILNIELPLIFVDAITQINAVFGQTQLDCIRETLFLANSRNQDKIQRLSRTNITRCIQWCDRYNIPISDGL